MRIESNLGLKGTLKIFKYEKKKLIEEYEYSNLITNVGLDFLLHLIGGDNNTGGINKMAIGSGATPVSKNDTNLSNRLLLLDVQKDYSVPGRINFMVNIPENTFQQIVNYNEAGLIHKNINSEILITRLIFGDAVYQKPENSLSFLYSLELKV